MSVPYATQPKAQLNRKLTIGCATAPCGGGGARRYALFGPIHAGGDGRRTAREYAGAVGMVPAIPTRAGAATGNGAAGAGTGRRHRARRSRSRSRQARAIIAVLLGRALVRVRGAHLWAPFGRIHTGGDPSPHGTRIRRSCRRSTYRHHPRVAHPRGGRGDGQRVAGAGMYRRLSAVRHFGKDFSNRSRCSAPLQSASETQELAFGW